MDKPKLIGYQPVLPIKRGDRVRIPKGTLVKTVYHGVRLAGKTYTVKVDHTLNGMTDERYGTHNPTVRWAGPGGYWSEADFNDVEKIDEPSSV